MGLLGNESHRDRLRREDEGRKAARKLESGTRTRITDAPVGGEFYYDENGNVWGVKSYGGVERITDPWTSKYKDIAAQNTEAGRLSRYDEAARRFSDTAIRDFQTTSELAGARQAGAVNATAGLAGMRRGLGDEYTAALSTEAAGRLRSEVLDSNLNFQQRIGLYLEQARLNQQDKSIDFFRNLDLMERRQEMAQDMMRFQAQLQSDLNSQSLFGDMLGNLFTVLGLAAFGPPGAVAGSAAGNAVSTTSYSDYDYMG